MPQEDKISIVVATDNHYAILLSALLKSIEVNHKTSEKIDVYVIDDGISPSSRKKLQSQVNPAMTSLYWFKTNDVIPPDVKMPVDKSAFPLTTYLRLFSPYIIPWDVKRVIYLDVDMLVLADISKLWHTDLGGNLFGAVPDLAEIFASEWGGVQNYKELGFAPDTKYFNAGMMVIDAFKWREEDITNKVIKSIHDNLSSANFPDQYGLNVTLANKWQVLDRGWNSFAVLDRKDPYLIHFLDIKPIFKSYNCNKDYQEEFYKYLRLTPWKNHKPVSDFRRLSRKAYNKIKKRIQGFLTR